MAAMKAYRFVGLNRDVWLPADIKVEIKIITSKRFRSYIPYNKQTMTTWHDTGNPKTNADDEYTWGNNGRPGGEVGGYNFIFDDKKIIQVGVLDEVTWAAGTATGNTISWHAEQAWGGNVNFQRSLEVGAALHGGLIAAMGWSVDKALVKHQYWYGKWCPGQILNKGLWNHVVQMTKDAVTRAVNAAGGKVVVTPPAVTYAEPKPIALLHIGPEVTDTSKLPATVTLDDGTIAYFVDDIVEAIRPTKRLQYANDNAALLNENIKQGERFRVHYIFVADNGKLYYYSPWATRILVSDTKRVSDLAA